MKQIAKNTLGISNTIEFVMAFLEWAELQHGGPTWDGIVERYGVSRATAYRWLRGYEQAMENRDAMKVARQPGVHSFRRGKAMGFAVFPRMNADGQRS